jgi:hypothetical protein
MRENGKNHFQHIKSMNKNVRSKNVQGVDRLLLQVLHTLVQYILKFWHIQQSTNITIIWHEIKTQFHLNVSLQNTITYKCSRSHTQWGSETGLISYSNDPKQSGCWKVYILDHEQDKILLILDHSYSLLCTMI